MKKLLFCVLAFGSISASASPVISLQPGSTVTVFPSELTTVTCAGSAEPILISCYCKDVDLTRVELRRKLIGAGGSVISDERIFVTGDWLRHGSGMVYQQGERRSSL